MSTFNESQHNRQARGTSAGGQFANKARPANDEVGLGSPEEQSQDLDASPANPTLTTRKIDKRAARKRWNRGLGVAMATDRTFFNSPQELSSWSFVTRADLVAAYGPAWADFDYMVSQTADTRNGAIAFAEPDPQGLQPLVERVPVPLSEIQAGDRIDVGAVGNWKVRGRAEGAEGETLLVMDGTLGDDDGPTLRVREMDGEFTAELLHQGEPYSDVSDSVAGGQVARHTPLSDPTLVREKIAESFPNAVFTEHALSDRSMEELERHLTTYGCAPGSYGLVGGSIIRFQSLSDPRRGKAVAVWEPNTRFADMVRRR